MPRIIIDYDADIPVTYVLEGVSQVVAQGLISKARGFEKFCHATRFSDYMIYVRDRRHEDAAHSFLVMRET